MFDYPPSVMTWSDWGWPSLISALVLGFTGWRLWRPRRRSLRTDPVTWCAFGFPVLYMLGFWSLTWVGVPSQTDDSTVGLIFLTALAVVHLGVLVCLAKSAWERSWEEFGRGAKYALLAIALGWVPTLLIPVTGHRSHWLQSLCKYSMKEIVLKFHDFHDREHHLPMPAAGTPPVSWRVNLLPYLDQKELFARYDQSQPWDALPNSSLRAERVRGYECPVVSYWLTNRQPPEFFYTSYALPVGPHALFDSASPRTFRDVPDGLSNVIALLEVCGMNIVWSEPRDVEIDKVPLGFNLPGSQPGTSDGVLSSMHRGGRVNVGFADGAVRAIAPDIDPVVLRRLLERDDGEPVGSF